MRIYLIGAHSTGKTTLLEYVKDNYSINAITEVARFVIRKYGGDLRKIYNDINLASSFQKDIIEEQLRKEKETEQPFIADRSIDILAYFCNYTKNTKEILEKEYMKEYIDSLKKEDAFVILIYPIPDLIENDGVREDICEDNIYAVHGMIKYILESNDIPYMILNTKKFNERARFIDNILKFGGIR